MIEVKKEIKKPKLVTVQVTLIGTAPIILSPEVHRINFPKKWKNAIVYHCMGCRELSILPCSCDCYKNCVKGGAYRKIGIASPSQSKH